MKILPLNLGPARLGRNVGRWDTITVCADFVGAFGRKGSEIVCAHAVRRIRAHSRPPLWTARYCSGITETCAYIGYRAGTHAIVWNLRADAATPYVAVVIGQKFSADANQEQKAMTQTRKVTPELIERLRCEQQNAWGRSRCKISRCNAAMARSSGQRGSL